MKTLKSLFPTVYQNILGNPLLFLMCGCDFSCFYFISDHRLYNQWSFWLGHILLNIFLGAVAVAD